MRFAVIRFTHPLESNSFTFSRVFDLPIKEGKKKQRRRECQRKEIQLERISAISNLSLN